MRGFAKKLLIMLYISSLLLLTTSCAPTLVGRIKAMQDAHNRGDVDKELSFFTDDVRCEFGEYVLEDKEQLRKAVEQNAIFNSRMTFSDCKETSNTVTCRIKEHNDMLKAAGIGPISYDFSRHFFENGLIKQVKAQPSLEGVRAMNEFQESFGKWASNTRARESAELQAEGFTKENINKWLALIRQWRKETQQKR